MDTTFSLDNLEGNFSQQKAEITRALKHFVKPDQIRELRALGVRRRVGPPHTEAGYFDSLSLDAMAEAALQLTSDSRGVYFTLNPLKRDLLARRCNRVDRAGEGELTKDKDVLWRNWLMIDIDPVRDAFVSATDGEKTAAFESTKGIRNLLNSRGWPDPFLCDSGNGYHLIYEIDLPAEDDGLVQRLLEVLATRFDNEDAKIDRSVYNPARICKVPYTFARKGDSTSDRPHRRACVLEVPTQAGGSGARPVPFELLTELASEISKTSNPSNGSGRPQSSLGEESVPRLVVDRWLTDNGRVFRVKPDRDSAGRKVYVLAECPFNRDHCDDACIMQANNGKLSAHCFHSSCAGKGWQEFRRAIGDPSERHYDSPLALTSTKFDVNQNTGSTDASTEITLPQGGVLKLIMSAVTGKPQRIVTGIWGDAQFRDRFNPDAARSRRQFIASLATGVNLSPDVLIPLLEAPLLKLMAETQVCAGERQFLHDADKSQATRAVKLAQSWDLWRNPSGEGFASLQVNDHTENWPVKSRTMKKLLAKAFYEETGQVLSNDALTTSLNLLEAQACFLGTTHHDAFRIAGQGGKIYVDLCNDLWEAIEITPTGWRVLRDIPIRFGRSRSSCPLPIPQRGGAIDLLRQFLNVDDTTFSLIVAWLVGAFRPQGPYPILALFAEHGSGKSNASRFLRDLVDPNISPLRSEPKATRDLMISATNSWCLAFDNLSHVPVWLSDALCRLSTGGGFSTRELYSDRDEVVFESQRPVILASIEDLASRSDLLDRCLIARLPAIPASKRRSEAELAEGFSAVRPLIMGAVLDAVSTALRLLPTTKPPSLPRMADFATWVSAAETGLGWMEGTFFNAYVDNVQRANAVALEASPLVSPLADLLEMEHGRFEGSATVLLDALQKIAPEVTKRSREWPKTAQALSGHLKRIAPNLRKIGIDAVQADRTAYRRGWVITRTSKLHFDATPEASPDGAVGTYCESPVDSVIEPNSDPDMDKISDVESVTTANAGQSSLDLSIDDELGWDLTPLEAEDFAEILDVDETLVKLA